MPFFRKKNRRFLFQRARAGRGVLRSGGLPMFRWQTTQTAVRSARDGGSIRWLAERPFARRTTSCATPAPAATVVRGRSPIARLIARLSAFPKRASARACAVPRNRRCGSSTAIYASTVRLPTHYQNPGTFDLAQHKGRYVAVLLWCLPHAKLLLSCCAFEFLTFYGAATRYSASSSIGNSSGDSGRWPVASVRSPRSIDIGLSSKIGNSSLTFPGVPRSGSVVSSHSHERNRTDGRVRDAKPHDMGLQISRGFHPEISA